MHKISTIVENKCLQPLQPIELNTIIDRFKG